MPRPPSLHLVLLLVFAPSGSFALGQLVQQKPAEVEDECIGVDGTATHCPRISADNERGVGAGADPNRPSDTGITNDESWNPQQLWSDSAEFFRQVLGGSSPSSSSTSSSGDDIEDLYYDPFGSLVEGQHQPLTPSDSVAGFFSSLLGTGTDYKEAKVVADSAKEEEDKSPSGLPDFFAAFQQLFGGGDQSEAATYGGSKDDADADDKLSAWEEALLGRLRTSQQTVLEESIGIKLERFHSTFKEVSSQLQRTFSHVPVERLNLFQVGYAILREEARKNPVWKRRQHRGLPELGEAEAVALFDGMYLSYLAYVETCQDVEKGLQRFYNASWVLVNCTTSGQPLQPAHFLAVKKRPAPANPPVESDPSLFPGWPNLFGGGSSQKRRRQELEVVLAIRGTKELGDAFSDALLEPSPYRDGWAHHGIQKSAAWIYDTYRDWILQLKRASQSTHVKLWLVGHSLGAGTAALASMEFNHADQNASSTVEEPNGIIEAHALGFGTPAVLSRTLSESVQRSVTTVINDADCVPRMSGATLANGLLEILQYNWTDDALEDLRDAMNMAKENAPKALADSFMPESGKEAVLAWFSSLLASMTKDLPAHNASLVAEPVLFPPGDCVHLYRDGIGWRGNYVPCRRFNELEMVPTLVDDHLINTGYYVGLLGFIRTLKKDLNWQFQHDLLGLPVR